MAVTHKTKAARASARRQARSSKPAASGKDAIALLEADHREVDGMFEQFETLAPVSGV
jgi:hypothetical protein